MMCEYFLERLIYIEYAKTLPSRCPEITVLLSLEAAKDTA